MCLKKIWVKLFKPKPPEKKKVKTWWDRFKEKFPGAKVINTSIGGLNMPGYQPCPECHAGSKRTYKLEIGAYYKCPKHGEFMVRR